MLQSWAESLRKKTLVCFIPWTPDGCFDLILSQITYTQITQIQSEDDKQTKHKAKQTIESMLHKQGTLPEFEA